MKNIITRLLILILIFVFKINLLIAHDLDKASKHFEHIQREGLNNFLKNNFSKTIAQKSVWRFLNGLISGALGSCSYIAIKNRVVGKSLGNNLGIVFAPLFVIGASALIAEGINNNLRDRKNVNLLVKKDISLFPSCIINEVARLKEAILKSDSDSRIIALRDIYKKIRFCIEDEPKEDNIVWDYVALGGSQAVGMATGFFSIILCSALVDVYKLIDIE